MSFFVSKHAHISPSRAQCKYVTVEKESDGTTHTSLLLFSKSCRAPAASWLASASDRPRSTGARPGEGSTASYYHHGTIAKTGRAREIPVQAKRTSKEFPFIPEARAARRAIEHDTRRRLRSVSPVQRAHALAGAAACLRAQQPRRAGRHCFQCPHHCSFHDGDFVRNRSTRAMHACPVHRYTAYSPYLLAG